MSRDGSDLTIDYVQPLRPGSFQPVAPATAVFEQWAHVRPIVLLSAPQFRPGPPPALTSAQYAADYNEIKSLGAANSTTRTVDQTQIALFWGDDDSYGREHLRSEARIHDDPGLGSVGTPARQNPRLRPLGRCYLPYLSGDAPDEVRAAGELARDLSDGKPTVEKRASQALFFLHDLSSLGSRSSMHGLFSFNSVNCALSG